MAGTADVKQYQARNSLSAKNQYARAVDQHILLPCSLLAGMNKAGENSLYIPCRLECTVAAPTSYWISKPSCDQGRPLYRSFDLRHECRDLAAMEHG